MVTSFYIMQMSNTKTRIDVEEHYDKFKCKSIKLREIKSLCRVCLKDGEIAICGNENILDIKEALRIFGDIEFNEDDDFPKQICAICYKFIREAILFRKVVKNTQEILSSPVQPETLDPTQHSDDYNDDLHGSKHSGSDNEQEYKIKAGKIDKVKLSTKVPCQICNKIITRSYYKQHLTMHDPNNHRYVCDVCGKSFRLRCAYRNHSLRHRDDFPFQCQFCPYKARYVELLKNHTKTHIGDYRYMCTECPARFLFKSNLNRHMLQHKVPQFKCEACKKAFHTKESLQRHIDSHHLGIKNHVCNICGKAFAHRNAMMKHQRNVHKREKISCGRIPSYLVAQRNIS